MIFFPLFHELSVDLWRMRDLRDCVCEIGSGTELVVYLAANVRSILLLVCRRTFVGRFAELCAVAMGVETGDEFSMLNRMRIMFV